MSPIGLVPKAHQAGKWCMIVGLLCPHGHSVNDGISPNLASIQYASVDHAVQIILSLGQQMELRLPTDKLHRLQSLVSAWARKKTCVRKELESFIGHLSHAATIVRQGRTFLRELFVLLQVARSPHHHHVRLNAVAKADIQWWTCFLYEWNGRSFLPRSAPSVHVYSDASGSFDCGAFQVGGSWCQLQWPESWHGGSIATLELIPIVIAVALWGPQWHGQVVSFHSDNVAAVCNVNRMFSSNSSLLHLLQCLSFFAAYFGFHFKAEHVPGVKNSVADALSRNNVHLFLSLVPQALARSVIPLQLQELLVGRIPDWGSSDWTILFRSCLPVALPL